MTIKYWTSFSKRKNSTKQPSGGTSATVTLKEGTSIESPVFLLSGDLFTCTYVEAFSHYYFVSDVISVRNGLTEIHCEMDPLATHKSAIGSYTAFIERCDNYRNPMIPDPMVAMTNGENVYTQVSTNTFFSSIGLFCLGCISEKGSSSGFCSYYIMAASELQQVAQYVCNSWPVGSDFFDWLQNTFLKTFESIISCIWLPVTAVTIPGTTVEEIVIGVDAINVYGFRITGTPVASDTNTITIPGTYTDFRRGAPYTTGKLLLPCYGMIEFNPIDFVDNEMHIATYVDLATGDAVYHLKDKNGKFISSVTTNIGVNCPIGKVQQNSGNIISGAVSIIGGVATGIGAAAHGLQGVTKSSMVLSASAQAINGLATALTPTPSLIGSAGGRANAESNTDYVCTVIERVTQDPDELRTTHGWPWMKPGTISSVGTGYIQCSNASVPIAGMAAERDAVNEYLNNGFYYE
ncbi:MAG: hypothetical protein IIZ78_15010 [Clostridiales bacterium]|nr:hypothetical protein [Clostridiales bacterium]